MISNEFSRVLDDSLFLSQGNRENMDNQPIDTIDAIIHRQVGDLDMMQQTTSSKHPGSTPFHFKKGAPFTLFKAWIFQSLGFCSKKHYWDDQLEKKHKNIQFLGIKAIILWGYAGMIHGDAAGYMEHYGAIGGCPSKVYLKMVKCEWKL